MPDPELLVVAETPSLARSIADLLTGENIPARCLLDLQGEAPLVTLADRYPILIVASAGPYSATVRRWIQGEMPRVELVVVGSRDPKIPEDRRIHRIGLPLSFPEFLGLIRDLRSGAPAIRDC